VLPCIPGTVACLKLVTATSRSIMQLCYARMRW
jgi:hypothetical protein